MHSELTAATGFASLAWLLIALPLAGAAILLLAGKRANAWGHLLGTAASLGSFVVGIGLLFDMLGKDAEQRGSIIALWDWILVGTFKVPVALQLDQLSLSFVLLITGVGSLIHIYSIGYMEHDHNRRKFFGYLNLFVAAMLTLVLADNYLLLYVGWEGVGLASYLLIGFWMHKPSAATAAKKAFVVNRVGDIGLSLAIMLMFTTVGTVTFRGVAEQASNVSENTLTLIGLALLLAACGKSAQFPLQSWLLDAMEGPTPVSALIHAATMVTAGVYLISRSHAIYDLAPNAQLAVVIIGGITLLMGAFIGTAKDDIKKALAGSTMSQIGYMILGAGLGPVGYVFALFHLITHGFFKAGMFLGAGSVMHGMHDDVNMRHYGAVRAAMPVTFLTFAMGYLAIIGFPGFSGFWSKDKIIETALTENWLVGLCALLGAGVTGFYMTRLMLMTFVGEKRWQPGVHPHESPAVMTGPLIVLAALSVLGGILLAGAEPEELVTSVTASLRHSPAIALGNVVGTIDGTATVDGQKITSWSPEHVGHTFTVRGIPGSGRDLFVSVPIPANDVVDSCDPAEPNSSLCAAQGAGYYPKKAVEVTFSFYVGEAGQYQWNCEYPCGGTRIGQFGNAMSTWGYMSGTLTVK